MVQIIPNSWGSTSLLEENPCHLPAGRPDGGRFCSLAERVGQAGGYLRIGVAEIVNSAIEKGLAPDFSLPTEEWQEQVLQRNVVKDVTRDIYDHPQTAPLARHLGRFTHLSVGRKFGQQPDAEAVAAAIIDGWATSSSRGALAVALQLAAADLFKVPDPFGGPFDPLQATELLEGRGVYAAYGGVLQTVLRGMYARTQRALTAAGVTEVTVLRGVTSAGQITTQKPLESYTADAPAATGFGTHAVIAVRVPASEVFSTVRTGLGTLGESEFVLIGRAHKARVYPRKEWTWPPKD